MTTEKNDTGKLTSRPDFILSTFLMSNVDTVPEQYHQESTVTLIRINLLRNIIVFKSG